MIRSIKAFFIIGWILVLAAVGASFFGYIPMALGGVITIPIAVLMLYVQYRLERIAKAIHQIAKEGQYEDIDEVIEAVKAGEIVTFMLADDIGFIHFDGEDVNMSTRGSDTMYSAPASEIDILLRSMDKDLQLAFFRNGTLFEVKMEERAASGCNSDCDGCCGCEGNCDSGFEGSCEVNEECCCSGDDCSKEEPKSE